MNPTHWIRTAGTSARQIRAMQRAGLIDLRRPDQVVQTARAMRILGPIAGGIRTAARRSPDRIAVVHDDRQVSYRELDERTDAIAARWHAEGLRARDTIGVLGPDGLRLVETMAAAAKLGCKLVLLNTGFGAAQLRDVLVREQVGALALDPSLTALAADLPDGITLLDTEGADTTSRLPDPAEQGGFVLLTGGTTGTPKGAPRRVESPLAGAQFVDRVPLRRGQTVLLCAPLFHGTALSQFILALNLGSTIVLHGRFDAARALAQIAEHRADMVVLVPTMLRRILDLDPEVLSATDTESLRIIFTAGAALPSSLGTRAIEVFGPVIYNFYGCTETGTATIATPQDWLAAPGTVGKAPVGISVALYTEDGTHITEPEVVGTVYVGNSIAFNGYSGGGSKQVRGGLMSTGDLGHFDSGGRLFIDGRDDDMIVSGGENVFPGEIEDLLYRHPAITEAAVVGVGDEEFGQRLAAFIVRGAELDADAVRAYVKTHLARFKAPRDVVFVDELPRTPTGKIDRRGIAALS
ncbi:acyl-CoA synthetase [Nocardia mangyaensis]|uniref:Acyl-CoA synthetase n=1 Tax=Nocardia mangyaensis TaxID=2213200 RepID=A0A1J0VWL3_9NOCA|nr:AMP-binding protein [Nocardia mangyaensis]APE36335.1 acyl-CoA synthetase [Nocardia mangyaensis]